MMALWPVYFIVVACFVYRYFNNGSNLIDKFEQLLLASLAAIGNYPVLLMIFKKSVSTSIRIAAGVSLISISIGYTVMLLYVPERWMKPGVADMKPWKSHCLWHIAANINQSGYISIAFVWAGLRSQ